MIGVLANRAEAELHFDWCRSKPEMAEIAGKCAAQSRRHDELSYLPSFAGYPGGVAIIPGAVEEGAIYESRYLLLEDVFERSELQAVIELREFTLHLAAFISLGSGAEALDFLGEGGPQGGEVRPRRKAAGPVCAVPVCLAKQIAAPKFRSHNEGLDTLAGRCTANGRLALLSARQGDLEGIQLSLACLDLSARLFGPLLHVVLNELLEPAQAQSCRSVNRLLAEKTKRVFSGDREGFSRICKHFRVPTRGFP